MLDSIQTMWAVVAVVSVALLTAVSKLPRFLREMKAQKAEDKKLIETQAAKQHRFNAALEHEGEMSRIHGANSPELLEAKKHCMELWKEVIGGE